MPIAARTYRSWKQPGRQPAVRTVTDATVMDALLTTVGTPEGLYGRRKMTAYLRRSGLTVAHCTVDRLMRALGLAGVVRGKRVRTTVPSADGARAGDLLNRNFTADAPNTVWVADFTYVRTWAGFVYVAFIVDVFANGSCPGTLPPPAPRTWCSPACEWAGGTAPVRAWCCRRG